MSEAVRALAANIVSRKQAGSDPYTLFIGAGASIGSGCSNMLDIADATLQLHDSTQFNAWNNEISEAQALSSQFGELLRNEINDQKLSRFFEIWSTLDSESRYAVLKKHLSEGQSPSSGYLDLAYLVKAKYFNVILSTNLDSLMEKALTAVGLIQPEGFIVIVNKKDSPEEIRDQLDNSRVPIKLVKLHGTLESPRSYAFTAEEIFNFEKTIKPSLTRIINQSLLIVGHSMQDRDISVLFEEEGREIHFVNPAPPRLGSSIDNVLKVRGLGSLVTGPEGLFDNFFGQLRAEIESLSKETVMTSSASSIEGFLRNIGFEGELKAPRSRYKNLETLYVKPTEYDDILNKLEKERILFIIGEPHMGKTYTALYLLWEYYQNGYETIHIRHDQFIHRLHRHQNNLRELLVELFTPQNQRPRIIHFDDPFGETSERRTDALANGLDTFLELARGYEHLRVVVTSRLNIFNEALEGGPIHEGLEALEKTLRVHTSYSREVLLDIFHRYVQFYRPAWANDKDLVAELNEKLPSMLPAPHNIEFFVNTSETLTSVEDVLEHVEDSKKMISALASWMKHMAPHEQIFLMWVEVCSTASILFAGADASEIDIEEALKENLAYLYRKGHLPGITTMAFSSARDKFETILLERRDESGGETLRLDFVHPSYHEAFWYAVNRKFPIAQWWELLSQNVNHILRDLEKGIDVVQLKMIERYGTINRDLDQLLLLSAASADADEQLIALDHMLRRPEQFALLPQFSLCVHSVSSQSREIIRIGFLDLYDKYFDQLPLVMLSAGLPLIFDNARPVRVKAQDVIGDRIDRLPESIRKESSIKEWGILLKLIPKSRDAGADTLQHLDTAYYTAMESQQLQKNFLSLKPSEIHQLIQIERGSKRGKRLVKIGGLLTTLILENYERIRTRDRDAYLEALYSPNSVRSLIEYLRRGREFEQLSDSVLLRLLNADGRVQYEALAALLLRMEHLSEMGRTRVKELTSDPPSWWVGASVGQVTQKRYTGLLSQRVKEVSLEIVNLNRKEISGALLSEMAQCYLDHQNFGLQEEFEPLLQSLIKDSEVVRHAEAWMDHSRDVFEFYDKEYWSNIKTQLRRISYVAQGSA